MRKSIEVDRAALVQAIAEAEQAGPLRNVNEVFVKATELYNSKAVPAQITFSVVGLRVKAWDLKLKTQPGKRGRQGPMSEQHKAAMQAARGARVPRSERFAANPDIGLAFSAQKARTPVKLHVLVDKSAKGSVKAAIKLMCLQCMGYEDTANSIRTCTSRACPIYPFRPYQNGGTEDEMIAVESAETSEAA